MKKSIFLLAALLFFPASSFAHTVGGGGFIAGLSHPVLGLDHLLAMVCVGILSAQIGGKAIWTIPLTFVGVMLIGGILGMSAVPFISVELGITLSVIVLGLALAAGKKFPTGATMLIVGFFALFHGHAHGTEMPTLVQPAFYALGFVCGTALIHLGGVLIGYLSNLFVKGPQLLRFCGAGVTCVGLFLLLG